MENAMNPRTLLVVLRASAAALTAIGAVLKTTKKK
jgi:hypothetical protein